MAPAESAGSDAPADSGASTTTASPPGTDVPQPCEPGVLDAPLEPLFDGPLGIVTSHDLDGDAHRDVFGGHGVAVLHAGLAVAVLADVPAANNGRPGDFDGDGVADVLFMAGVGLSARLRAWQPDAITVDTPAPGAGQFVIGDHDADGLDDVALAGADALQLWHSTGDGGFSLRTSIEAPWGGGSTAMARLGVDENATIVYSGGGSNHVALFSAVDDSVEPVGEFDVLDAFLVRGFESPTTGEGELLLNSWFSQLVTSSSVSVARRRGSVWALDSYDLDGAMPADSSPLDVDADGTTELVVLVDDGDRSRLDIACLAGMEYQRCAWLGLDERMTDLGTLADPPRVIVSSETQTWSLALPPTCCSCAPAR
ncbi:MAG: VCBS repeat-containing protein [Nannocystaceae bacterium]